MQSLHLRVVLAVHAAEQDLSSDHKEQKADAQQRGGLVDEGRQMDWLGCSTPSLQKKKAKKRISGVEKTQSREKQRQS